MNLNKDFINKFSILTNIGFILLLISFILPGSNIGSIEVWKFIDIYILFITLIYIYIKSNLYNIKGVFKKLIYLFFPFKNIKNKIDKYFLIYIYTYVYIIIGDSIFSFFNYNEPKMIFQQSYSLLTIALKITFIFFYLRDNKEKEYKINVLRILYFFMIVKIVLKLTFAIYAFSKGLDYKELMIMYKNLFGGIIMSQPIGGAGFLRIDTVNDVLPFYIFLFYLYDKNVSKLKKVITSLLMFLYVLIIYSRVFIAFYIFSLIVILLQKFIISIKKKNIRIKVSKNFIIITIICLILLIGGSCFISKTKIYNQTKALVVERFVGDSTQYSDDIRSNQKKALVDEIYKRPLIGKGPGSYADTLIRSEINKYSYELEYLALIMQFGIIGFLVLIVGMFIVSFNIFSNYINNKNRFLIVPILLCTIFQVSKMITNPFFDKIIIFFLVILACLVNSENFLDRKNFRIFK